MKYTRVLAITSPHMHGNDVTHAQNMLNSKAPNAKHGDFRPGVVDANFGPNTAAACRRAKYWLGFPNEDVNRGTYGQNLEDILNGTKRLSEDYRKRRTARLKKALETPLRARAFNIAKGELGVKEDPPDSNRVKYSSWYGITGSWCAMFVTWCYVHAGAKESFVRDSRYAYVPYMVDAARGRDWHLTRISRDEVQQGDIVTFDWEGGGMTGSAYSSDHVGLFDRWITKSSGLFKTIEGNTGISNDSNGGEVMSRDRSLSLVSCFIRAEI